jgi:hypothetical protein
VCLIWSAAASGIPRDAAFKAPRKRCRASLAALLVTALQKLTISRSFLMQTQGSTVDSGPSNKGILFVIVGLCAGIILFSALYLLFDWRSSPSPATYADLTAHQPAVSENENAFTCFSAAINALYTPSNSLFFNYINRYPKPKPVDTNLLKQALLKNQQTFELLKQGIAFKSCVPPDNNTLHEGYWDFYIDYGRFYSFIAAKFRLELVSHQYREATDSCITLFYFSDRLLQHPSSYPFFLAGCISKGASVSMIRELINTPDLPDDLFEQLAALVDHADNLSEAALHSIKMDCGIAFRTIEKQYRDTWLRSRGSWESLLTTFYLKPNTTKHMILPYYRQMIAIVPLTYAEAEKMPFQDDVNLPRCGDFRQNLVPNLEGLNYCDGAISQRKSLSRYLTNQRNHFSATRIAIAYQRYLKKEGHPPESLTDLVPTYLPAVPIDWFDGQPLRYLPKEKLLYSVDKDLKDSKAVFWTEGKSWKKNQDQVYPLTPDATPLLFTP